MLIHNQNFDILERIGGGGFCEVMKAKNLFSKRTVALKVLDTRKSIFKKGKEEIIEKKLREYMIREYNVLKHLDHQNLLKCFNLYQDDQDCFLELELVNKGELFDRIITEKRLKEPSTIDILYQLGTAVKYMHSKGYVHRDIKPENILFHKITSGREIIKLCDMGLSKLVKDKTYTNCGTIEYCAPEMIRNKTKRQGYGKGVDIWSIGVVVYVCLAGYQPFNFPAKTESGIKECILKCSYDFHPVPWNTLSFLSKHFIRSVLVPNPSDRLNIDKLMNHIWLWKYNRSPEKSRRILLKNFWHILYYLACSLEEFDKRKIKNRTSSKRSKNTA